MNSTLAEYARRCGLNDIERAALVVASERHGPDEAIRIEARRSTEWERCMAAARTAA